MPRRLRPGQVVDSTAVKQTTFMRGPHPIAVGMANALAAQLGSGIRGTQGGHIRIGLTGARCVSFRGDLGPLQTFSGWVTPMNLRNIRKPNAAFGLPNTQPPAGTPSTLISQLAASQRRRSK